MYDLQEGSLFQNFVTFNPLKWKSEIKITYNDSTIYLTININTIGQTPTLKEEQLWDTFISNFEVTIRTEKDMTQNNKQALKNTKSNSFRLVGWALIGAIVFGIPAGMLGYYTNIDRLVGFGAGIGILIVMIYKNDKEKQSKGN
ncbi:hypothetical protein [Sporocytophaga myxococcoides]|nr:hypothetical protein [Sporocytophaga myxococcoides]